MILSENICLFLNNFFPKPAMAGRESTQAYSEMEYTWGKNTLETFAPFIDLKNKKVLDAGCGLGGRTVYYAQNGCESITGIDIDEKHIKYSREFAHKKGVTNADFTEGCLSKLPFESDSFDIIFMNDVLEHIGKGILLNVLEECKRVVKKDGRICLEFPPWTSALAAHLYDYIHIPWCHICFSEKTLISVIKRIGSNSTELSNWSIEKFQGLNQITASEFHEMIKQLNFNVIHYDERMIKNIKSLRYVPFINKYLISRVNAVLSK